MGACQKSYTQSHLRPSDMVNELLNLPKPTETLLDYASEHLNSFQWTIEGVTGSLCWRGRGFKKGKQRPLFFSHPRATWCTQNAESIPRSEHRGYRKSWARVGMVIPIMVQMTSSVTFLHNRLVSNSCNLWMFFREELVNIFVFPLIYSHRSTSGMRFIKPCQFLPLLSTIDFAHGVGWFHPNIENKIILNTEKPSSTENA